MFRLEKIKKLVMSQNFWLWAVSIAAICFLLIYAVFITLSALSNGIAISTYPTNGTFQLYNPLRRLDLGQKIGADFPFFHGVGVPWLHYPIYKLLGSNIFAAEAARIIISPVMFILSTLAFFYAFFRDVRKTFIASALITIAALLYLDVVTAIGSLRGLRGTFPVFVAAALLWQTKHQFTFKKFHIPSNDLLAIILLAVGFAFSTEHGIAAIIAYIFTKMYQYWKQKTTIKIMSYQILIRIVIIIALSFVVLAILTRGYPIEALRYALIEIPADQGWYFGSPPNTYLTWDNLLPSLFRYDLRFLWAIIVLGLISSLLIIRSPKSNDTKKYASIYSIVYGISVFAMTSFGYYLPEGQLKPLARGVGLIFIALLIELVFGDKKLLGKITGCMNCLLKFAKATVPAVIILIIGFYSLSYYRSFKNLEVRSILNTSRQARNESDYFAANPIWKKRIDSFEPYFQANPRIWSTYTGLYDSVNQQIGSSTGGEDYIIHALGETRRENYVNDFINQKPDYAITLVPNFFYYEEWLWSNSWSFYKHLMTNYDLVAQNDSHYLWELRPNPVPQEYGWVEAEKSNDKYLLPHNNDNGAKVFEVRISYDASAKPLDNMPRYLINIHNIPGLQYPIALPPYLNEQTFVVPLFPSDNAPYLSPDVQGIIPWGELKIDKVEYRLLNLTSDNILPFVNNYCAIPSNLPNEAICSEKTALPQ